MKIGLSWQGGTVATRRVLRSIPLQDLALLLEVEGCHFVNLQYGDTLDDRVRAEHATGRTLHHWPEAIDDLDQCAALISSLDLVISVCTMVIHLAGAVACPVWVMVPRNPEWRYCATGEDMPWYPSATMIRQQSVGDWHPVIAEVTRRLRSHLRPESMMPA
jgi:ADP-heptose:LPS heptosyltransferase